jgi:RNA polymerase-binding protein DksA
MTSKQMEGIAVDLRRRRALLLQEVTENEEDMRSIIEQRESELEESAQKDGITRVTGHLSERGQRMIREINNAFERMTAGVYGECERCGSEIGIGRLRALPTATLCIECATLREKKTRSSVMAATAYFPGRGYETEDGLGAPETED